MDSQNFGEATILLGVLIVAASLAPILGDISLPTSERYVAIAGVAAIILGEALVLSN